MPHHDFNLLVDKVLFHTEMVVLAEVTGPFTPLHGHIQYLNGRASVYMFTTYIELHTSLGHTFHIHKAPSVFLGQIKSYGKIENLYVSPQIFFT